MLSAGLLNTGMYAVIRFLAITQARLGDTYPRAVLLSFGFASIIVGALFMVRRGNFKRLFAYSSVEHMGIIAFALGFGGLLGFYGALLQILNHALAKSVLFLSSGDVVLRYRTRDAADVTGLLAAVPVTGGALLFASFAVLGSPPFGLFLSELTIVRAGFAGGRPALSFLLLGLLGLAFVAFARTTTGMVTGPAAATMVSPYGNRGWAAVTAAPLIIGIAALLVLGLWVPAGLDEAIRHSIAVIT